MADDETDLVPVEEVPLEVRLRELAFGDLHLEVIADSLRRVILGQRVVTRQEIVEGRFVDVERTISVSPKDAARGLALADRLTGGALGFTRNGDSVGHEANDTSAYKKFNRGLDVKIVPTKLKAKDPNVP